MKSTGQETNQNQGIQSTFPLLSQVLSALNKSETILLQSDSEDESIQFYSPKGDFCTIPPSDSIKAKSVCGQLSPNILSPRPQCYFVLPIKGISFRRIELPEMESVDLRNVVGLQLEQELPISLSEFAWGFYQVETSNQTGTNVCAALIRKNAPGTNWPSLNSHKVQEFHIPGIIEVGRVLSQEKDHFGIVNIEKKYTEYVRFKDGYPETSRSIAISSNDWNQGNASEAIQSIVQEASDIPIFFLGNGSIPGSSWDNFCQNFSITEGRWVNLSNKPDQLISLLDYLKDNSKLDIQSTLWMESDSDFSEVSERQYQKKEIQNWAIACVALLVAILGLRYVEPLIKTGAMTDDLKSLQAQVKLVPEIEKEVAFLKMISDNHLPFEAIVPMICSQVNSQFQLEEVIMSQRGDLNISARIKTADQVGDLRQKLMASGFFRSVVIESQTPDPKKKNIALKIRAAVHTHDKVRAAYQKLIKDYTEEKKT